MGVARRQTWVALWLLCGLALPLSVIRPETTSASKLLTLLSFVGLLTIPVRLAWFNRTGRAVVCVCSALSLTLLLPGREADATSLRAAYLGELRTWDTAHYVWGGENHRGIDCSGLVRRALVGALSREAASRIDPGLARRAFELWWFDASAEALGQGYRGWTHEVTRANDFGSLDLALLEQGDLAVTQDGLHVLAYLGDATWIQADPVPMRVHVERVSASGWFTHPIVVMRWRLLE